MHATTEVPVACGRLPSRRLTEVSPIPSRSLRFSTIVGPGADLLTLNGTGQGPDFDIQGGSVALSGITIIAGNGELGGGLLNAGGTVSLNHVVVRGNRALAGGSLYNNGTATLNHVLFSGNHALVGGGLYNDSTATLTNVLIHGNRSRVGSSLFNTRRAIFHWRRALVDRPRQARNSIEPPARTSSITSN